MNHVTHFYINGAPACRPNSAHFWGNNGVSTAEAFDAAHDACAKCAATKTVKFIMAKSWIPENPDAWKIADDALIAARRSA